MKPNEATLESNVNKVLNNLFPKLNQIDFEHQKTFTVQIGHHSLSIDTEHQHKVGARLDILIRHQQRNFVIIELKHPREALSEKDKKQGISYARLLTPIPPLVIVSNGSDSIFYNTFTEEEWMPDTLDAVKVKSLFKQGLTISALSMDEAVKYIVGGNPDLWEKIIAESTSDNLEEQIGECSEFTYPIASGFSLKREITDRLLSEVNEHKVIALLGSPLSGKTNVLQQFCQSCLSEDNTSVIPWYLDGSECSNGILQFIANELSRKLFTATTQDDVRGWFMHSLTQRLKKKIVIVIDHFKYDENSKVTTDIIELLQQMHHHKTFSIIVAMDTSSYHLMSNVTGTHRKRNFGRMSIKLELSNELSNQEFEWAIATFQEKYYAKFHEGAVRNRELRIPYTLRVIACQLSRGIKTEPLNPEKYHMLPSFKTFNDLIFCWKNFIAQTQLREDYVKLAKAFISDSVNRKGDIGLMLLSYGYGRITFGHTHKELGNEVYNRLKNQGHIEEWDWKHGEEPLVISKFPDAFSAAGAIAIYRECKELYKANRKEETFETLLNSSELFPGGDKVAAYAAYLLSNEFNFEYFLREFISYSIAKPPVVEKADSTNNQYSLLIPQTNIVIYKIPADFFEEDESYVTSNRFPWLVISQVAFLPLGDENESRDCQLEILEIVGSYPKVFLRNELINWKNSGGLPVHDVKGGSYLCGEAGIVEPITFAMQSCFYEMPQQMLRLCEKAILDNNKFLAFRLTLAAKSVLRSSDEMVSFSANEAIEILKEVVYSMH